jgi:hypothetical protein
MLFAGPRDARAQYRLPYTAASTTNLCGHNAQCRAALFEGAAA